MLDEVIAEYESSNDVNGIQLSVASWFDQWLEIVKSDVRPNTYRSYCGNMRNHIIPYFAERKILLCDLTSIHLEDFYRHKVSSCKMESEENLSATTIKHFHENINKALEDAVKRGFIPSNPARRAKPPKVEKYRAHFINLDEVSDVLSLFGGTVLEIPVTLCAVYGLRRSEAVGLKWSCVDFVNRTITIAETLQQGIGGDYSDKTKTESSYRTLPFTESVEILLRGQRERQQELSSQLGTGYQSSDYVCTWEDGHVVSPNYLSANFHRIVSKHGYTIRLHDLRHSAASNLLAMGFSIVEVSSWLGHSSPTTTLSFYSHVNVDRSRRDMANALNGVLTP